MPVNPIKFSSKGDWLKTRSFLEKSLEVVNLGWLDYYGKKGVEALKAATPIDTGLTANSWEYVIDRDDNGNVSLSWVNNNGTHGMGEGINMIILLEYGHGTRGGTYVEGRNFINPALKPILDEISAKIGKEMER